jgi:hypothetical protein
MFGAWLRVRDCLRGQRLPQQRMEIVHLDSLGCHPTGPIVAAVRYYLSREYHARKVRFTRNIGQLMSITYLTCEL